jgi:dienelactone hydrolase
MHKTLMFAVAVILTLGAPTVAQAEVKTQEVEYKQGDTVLQGFVAWDDAKKGKRPGVLVVHEWWGHNQHARNQAIRLAEAGYVGFALDMYGKGKVAEHPDNAQAFMKEATKDASVVAARFTAALEQIQQHELVDTKRMGAIGYCFGGAVVLGQARAGADLKAVASFHGAIATETPAQPGKVKAKIIVLNGAADPMVTPEQREAFKKEMKAAKVKYEFIDLKDAKHGFTNPDADKHGMPALAYNAEADKKSWAEMLRFFKKNLDK